MSHNALITGAASGIGRHLTGRLLAKGYRVLAADVDLAALEAARLADSWGEGVKLCALDIRQPAAWEAALAQIEADWGRLDVLINNAGVIHPAYSDALDPAQIERQIDVNVKGTMLGTTYAARRMRAQGGGHIVNVASLAGVAPVPGLPVYTGSKFAVRGFSLVAALELRPYGVYVTVVCPDAVQTPMLDYQEDFPEAAITFSGPRAFRVEEIGAAILKSLETKPLEVLFPAWRGWLAKLSSLWPRAAFWMLPWMTRQGRIKQNQRKHP
jgi:3-oxoacyl-[acyl-carrier protein] reductase